jgi:glycyl-tRNA synthetase beta subunit
LNVDFDLRQGLALAAETLPVAASPEVLAACCDFIVGRMRAYLLEMTEGARYDVVDAVLAAQAHNPAGVFRAVQTLAQHVARPDWNTILPTYARCVRITRDQKQIFALAPQAFTDPAEQALYQALQAAQAAPRRAGSLEDFFAAFLPLMPVINRFFEAVLVMAEDPQVRANRLGLLQQVAALTTGAADFSKLEGF